MLLRRLGHRPIPIWTKDAILVIHLDQWRLSLAFKPRRMVQGLAWGGAFLLASALVSGCSPAQYTYVSDSGNSTYYKVPHYWGQVSSTDLCHQLESYSQTSTCPAYWTSAYEGQRPAAASGFLDFDLNKPFIYAQVTPYSSTSATALTDQTLEDAFLPVSESSRETESAEGFPLTGFKSLLDEPVSLNGGYHGVREVFDYTQAWPRQPTPLMRLCSLTAITQISTCFSCTAQRVATRRTRRPSTTSCRRSLLGAIDG